MSWWLWLFFGIVLLLLELVTPGGFYVFFFGLGAIAVGLLAWLGIPGSAWLQWLVFAALSVASLLLFRRPLQQRLIRAPALDIDSMIGEVGVALTEIGAQQIGKVELRGSAWNAQNMGDSAIAAGQRCRVEGVHGLTLYVCPEIWLN